VTPSEITVTVMSFNIHHGRGTDDVLDLERIAGVIAGSGAGIAGLQEVDRDFAERSDWTDQPARSPPVPPMHRRRASTTSSPASG
jgi:endonuclease/exonuclease/phosphatase family metal-dependent hydrolase